MAKQKLPLHPVAPPGITKAPTGIEGLDQITGGGLPAGRPTLVCGAAGCGKTLFAAEFLARGAAQFGEPGVFMMFEENAAELIENVRSLGFDLDRLQQEKMILLDHVHIERSEIEETGEYDLEGLFIRLGYAIDSIGAKRVVLDTLEALFAGLPSHAILRAELRRLFRWLKDRGITAVITGERGDAMLTRYGLEEYVADCVILLDHRIIEQISTRRLKVIKYRGSAHGTNEYPFLISSKGISVLPITSLRLDHVALEERVLTGISGLDEMFDGKGIYRGSSMLVSGAPGTGKSSIGVCFADAACRRGEHALLFVYEESASQITRNMRSIGIDLETWVRKGLLHIHASRPTLHGLEQHLVHLYDLVRELQPSVVIVDPISNLVMSDEDPALKPTLMRLIDHLKHAGVTALFSSLTSNRLADVTDSEVGVSSLMDSWVLLRNVEYNGERTRTLQVLKSRGMPHSNQVREFVFSDSGVDLVDVFVSGNHVLTGTARITGKARDTAATQLRELDHGQRVRELARRRKEIDAQILSLNADQEHRSDSLQLSIARENLDAKGPQSGDVADSTAPVPGRRKARR